jgi:hypothetical protein
MKKIPKWEKSAEMAGKWKVKSERWKVKSGK